VNGRLLRAFIRLRWRLLVNGLRSGSRRGVLEEASRWLQAAVPILFAILAVPVVLAMAAGGVIAGIFLARSQDAAIVTAVVLAMALTVPLLWVVLRPLLPGGDGASGREDLPRILPVPMRFLRHFELMRVLMDPIVLLFVPAVLLVPVGTALAGRLVLAVMALVASVSLVALLAAGGGVVALAVRLLLRDRRRGEVVTLIVFLLLSVVGFLPQVMMTDPHHQARLPGRGAEPRNLNAGAVESKLPGFLQVLPSGLYGLALGLAAEGAWWQASVRVAALAGMAVAAYGAAIPLHRRLLTTPVRGAARRTTQSQATSQRIPFVQAPTAAVAAGTVRLLLRTVRGRMLLLSPPVVGLLLAVMASRMTGPGMTIFASPLGAAILLAVVSVISVQALASNQFAIASGGLVFELLLPLSVRSMVRGRALGFLGVGATCLLLGQVPLVLLLRGLSAPVWLAIVLGALSVQLALLPVAAVLGALFPKTVDLAVLGHAGKPHPAASALTMMASSAAAVVPLGLGFVAVRVLSHPWLAPVLVGAWVGVCLGVSWVLLPVAERFVAARRENLALVAMGR
jgi:hypothetical protein